jgi:hypothetical protein
MMYTQELQSPALTLLLRTPNGRQGVGQNREKWIPSPEATSALELEMFAFLGKLMGIAIRSKEYLALSLPSIVWKLLAGDSPDQWDLEGVDFSLAKSLDLLRGIRCDEAQFAQTFFETFTTTSSADRTVELLPGGARRDVTYESRHQYCDLVTQVRYCSNYGVSQLAVTHVTSLFLSQYRLHEFDLQAAAIRRGLATIVPLPLLVSAHYSVLLRYLLLTRCVCALLLCSRC